MLFKIWLVLAMIFIHQPSEQIFSKSEEIPKGSHNGCTTNDLEIQQIKTLLSSLNNITHAQNQVILQQERNDQEMKIRHKLEEEQMQARSEALENEQHLLKEIRGEISRKLKRISKNSAKNLNKNNQYHSTDKLGQKDCADIYLDGEEVSGVYRVWSSWNINSSFYVYCDMDTDGGGWTVIHRQGNVEFPVGYFLKTWADYKKGFGDHSTDFWLGNENIRSLTNQGAYNIRLEFGTGHKKEVSLYNNFWIEDEGHKYKLHVFGYVPSKAGTGDILSVNNGGIFSTIDQPIKRKSQCYSDCTKDCTTLLGNNRTWWYKEDCMLDRRLKIEPNSQSTGGTEIKIRPANFQKSKESL